MAVQDPNTGEERIIFETELKIKKGNNKVMGDPVSLVATNIRLMMGGQAKMWESGIGKQLGIMDQNGKVVPRTSLKLKEQQAHDDDQLELQIIPSSLQVALGKAN